MSAAAPAPTGPVEAAAPRRLSPLTPVVRGFYLVVAFAATSWDDVLRGDVGPLGWLLLALLVAGSVFGAASWLRTSYRIHADELRVDTGLVSRRSRRIRVDRLQGIDVVQPFVARLFGLAELRFDVAGGGDEGKLAFLPMSEAERLRTELLDRRDAVRRAREGVSADSGSVEQAPAEPARVVARLDLGMLVLSILFSSETAAFVVSAALAGALFATFGGFGGVAGVLTFLAGFAITALRRLSAFYDFTLTRDGAGLHVRRGLFERSTQTIVLQRVQGVVVTEPLLWRRQGWARLDVSVARQASSDTDGGDAGFSSTVMPVAPRAEVLALAGELLAVAAGLGEGVVVRPDAVLLTPAPDRARWVAPVRRRWMLAGQGEHLVGARHGLLTRRTHVVPYARIQSLRLRQGPWQRRFGLADLLVDSPPGPVAVRARHRDAREARRLLDEAVDRAREARALRR